MNFVEFFLIQLNRVVKDFELNPLVIKKIGFGSKLANPHH